MPLIRDEPGVLTISLPQNASRTVVKATIVAIKTVLRRGARFVLRIDGTELRRGDLTFIPVLVKELRKAEPELRSFLRGTAVVVGSASARCILCAVLKLKPPVAPIRVTEDPLAAEEFVAQLPV